MSTQKQQNSCEVGSVQALITSFSWIQMLFRSIVIRSQNSGVFTHFSFLRLI